MIDINIKDIENYKDFDKLTKESLGDNYKKIC